MAQGYGIFLSLATCITVCTSLLPIPRFSYTLSRDVISNRAALYKSIQEKELSPFQKRRPGKQGGILLCGYFWSERPQADALHVPRREQALVVISPSPPFIKRRQDRRQGSFWSAWPEVYRIWVNPKNPNKLFRTANYVVRSLFFSPQSHISSKRGMRDFPRSVKLYSTLGGIWGYSSLCTS